MKTHVTFRLKPCAKFYELILYKLSMKFHRKYHGEYHLLLECRIKKVDKYLSADILCIRFR